MTWKTLAESLESALASMVNEVGEGAIVVASDAVTSKEPADAETPAAVAVDVSRPVNTERAGTGTRAQQAPLRRRAAPARPVCLYLVVSNEGGGRSAREGGASRAAYRAGAAGERAREWLRLVHDVTLMAATGKP